MSAALLTWGIAPPAIRHGHEGGGDRGHGHDAVVHHDPEHGHHDHDGGGHRHNDADASSLAVLSDFVVHLHWDLFGLDFSIPMPENGEHGDDGDGEPAVVRFIDELPTMAPYIDSFAGESLATPPDLGPDAVVVVCSPSHPPNRISSIPLCDTARFERSGVLLA